MAKIAAIAVRRFDQEAFSFALPPIPIHSRTLAPELMQFAIGLCMRPPNEQTNPGVARGDASECLHVRKFTRTELLHDERLWMMPLPPNRSAAECERAK